MLLKSIFKNFRREYYTIVQKRLFCKMKSEQQVGQQQSKMKEYEKILNSSEDRKQKNRKKMEQLSKSIYPLLQKYHVTKKVKILYVYSLYNIRNQQLFSSVEDSIASRLDTLKFYEIIKLLQTLYNFHKHYRKQLKIFKHLDIYLLKKENIEENQVHKLFNILIKLKWPHPTLNKIFLVYYNQGNKKTSYKQILKTGILISQQPYINIQVFQKIIQVIFDLSNKNLRNLSKESLFLTYYFLYSKFLHNQFHKISQFRLAKNSVNSFLGRQNYQYLILQENQKINNLLNQINQSKPQYQKQILLKIDDSLTVSEGVLILSFVKNEVRQKLQHIFKQKFLSMTILEFVEYFRIFTNKDLLEKYYKTYKTTISMSQKIYIFKKLFNLDTEIDQFIKKQLLEILENIPIINSIQFETLVKLAVKYNIDSKVITKFMSAIQQKISNSNPI